MQKITFLLCFFLALSTVLFANKIDSLKTDTDVENFVRQFIGMSEFKIVGVEDIYSYSPCYIRVADSLGVKGWIKADFDNNGKTDLLLNLSENGHRKYNYDRWFVVMDEVDSFRLVSMQPRAHGNDFRTVIEITGLPSVLVYRSWNACISHGVIDFDSRYVGIDTLQWIDDNFIEPNAINEKHTIDSIKFSITGGMIYTPKTELTISRQLTAQYDTIEGGKRKGSTVKISDKRFQEMNSLFNHIILHKSTNEFEYAATDGVYYNLKIFYDTDKTYSIEDYGGDATYGLIAFYAKLDTIIESITASHN